MTKDEEELKVIYSALDDCRRLIAAGKVQRWDVVKWGVAVNVGLATAAAAIPFKGAFNLFGLAVPFSLIPFLLAVLVAFTSWLLVLHYNRRATAHGLPQHCPPSAVMRQIGWVEEGRISGSS